MYDKMTNLFKNVDSFRENLLTDVYITEPGHFTDTGFITMLQDINEILALVITAFNED